jgi:hypothetical protein
LPELLRRESRSYLHYIRESFPYARGADQDLRARVVALAQAEDAEIARLGRLLQKHRITLPFLGSFPVSFTSSNFVSISYLLPRVIADQKHLLADLEQEIPKISDQELHAGLESYRELKRKNLEALESLNVAQKAAG